MSQLNISNKFPVIGILFVGVIAASTGAIFIRLAQADGVASFVIAAVRLLLASVILIPISFVKYRSQIYKFHKIDWFFFLLSGFFLACHFAFWISSLEYTSIASSVILVSTTPIWVIIIGSIFLNESSNKVIVLGMLIAIVGSIIIGLDDICSIQINRVTCAANAAVDNNSFIGDFLALLGAFSAAGYLLIGRRFRSRIPLIPYISIVYFLSALILITISVISRKPFVGFPPITYLWLILLALIPQLVGHSIINWSLKFLPPSVVSVSLLGESIGSSLFAYLLFSENVSFIKFSGFLLLLLGIWFSTRDKPAKGISV